MKKWWDRNKFSFLGVLLGSCFVIAFMGPVYAAWNFLACVLLVTALDFIVVRYS